MTLGTALRQGTEVLDQAAIPAARLTAEVLLCHAAHCGRTRFYSHPEEELTEAAWIHYGRYLHERLQGKPTQYITGRQEFYGREFRVTPDVLIPRPETEHLVETALELAPAATNLIDVGCGSGAIAVTLKLELPVAQVFASDISMSALKVARANARALGADVAFFHGDLLGAVAAESCDLVVSNPPYVPESDKSMLQKEVRDFEPEVALYGGPTGVEIYLGLIDGAARVLRPGGWLILEIAYRAEERVRRMLAGWRNIRSVADLAGIPRVVAAERG